MTRSEQINELAAALATAQGQIKGAVKDSANPFFKSKYADLASVWEACRQALSTNGLSVLQSPQLLSPSQPDGSYIVMVQTLLMHASGQWVQDTAATPIEKMDAQGVGSATTYLRRYALSAFVGVAPEDDDGNAAVGNTNGKAKQESALPKPQGYDQWLDDLKATADEGTEAVRAAWLASGKDVRAYLSATSPKELDAIRAKAAKAGVTA